MKPTATFDPRRPFSFIANGSSPLPRTAAHARRPIWLIQLGVGLALTALYTVLTAIFTWPLTAYLGNAVVSPVDPVDSIWRIAWAQERILRAPWRLFDGNTFYPYARSYLFDELLFGEALLTLPLRLVTDNPVAIYNLAVLSSLVLSGLGGYALARQLGAWPVAAFAAGAIYAFAPLHLGHLGHVGILSGQWFPLAIVLLDRLFTAPRWRDALALAAALALQALSSQYYAFYLIFVVGGFVGLRLVQLGLRRRFPSLAVWTRLVTAGGLAALAVLPFFLGYRTVQGDYTVERTIAQNAYYSANLTSFFTTDPHNWLWGRLTAPLRAYGAYTFERNLFPGALALVLALVGALTHWRQPLAQYLILLGAGSAILALGPGLYLTADNKSLIFDYLPYRYLYYHLPGFDSMRVPARIGILYGLSVAALAGAGSTWLLRRLLRARLPRWRQRPAMTVAALALIGGIGLESLNTAYALTPLETGDQIPPVYRWLATQPHAVAIELPLLIPDHDRELRINNRYQYFSLYHRRRTVNGSANVVPKGYKALFYEFRRGPTPRALAILQGLGVTDLVVHYDQLDQSVAERTRATLAERPDQVREVAVFGTTAVYRLTPTDRFAQLRAAIPPGATIYLSRQDPARTGAYMAMLGRLLRDNQLYTRIRVEFGQQYAGPPVAGARYDYAILYLQEDPAAVGFAGAAIVWQDDVVRVYRRAGP